jgi:hypothetical protein
MYYFSQHFYFIKYEIYKIVVFFVVATLIIFLLNYFKIENKAIDILLRLFAIIVFPFLLYLFNVYENVELSTFKTFIKKYLGHR